MKYCIKMPGRYYQGDGIINNLGDYVKHLGKFCGILGSKNGMHRYNEIMHKSLCNGFSYSWLILDSNKLIGHINSYDFLIGIGGGSVLDHTKRLADKYNIPYVMIPTVLSSDAASNSMSVPHVYDNKDTMMVRCTRGPEMVIADTSLLSDCPRNLLLSGIADALSTNYEAESSSQTTGYTMTHATVPDGFLSYSNKLRQNIVLHSKNALNYLDTKDMFYKDSFDIIVRSILFDSSILSENCGIAIPHAFSLAVDEVLPYNTLLHGYKVSVGLLLHLYVIGNDKHAEALSSFMKSIGLPTRLSDLNIKDPKLVEFIVISLKSNKLLKNSTSKEVTETYLFKLLWHKLR